MKKNKTKPQWVDMQLRDPYVKQAKREGYRSRAVYKIAPILTQYHLLTNAKLIVELGAAPGAWTQWLHKHKTTGTRLIALDLLPLPAINDVIVLQGNFLDNHFLQTQLVPALQTQPIDLLLSDMAPNLSGIKARDAAHMFELLESLRGFAEKFLSARGSLVCKCFHNETFVTNLKAFESTFKHCKIIKPKASRDFSTEVYLLARN